MPEKTLKDKVDAARINLASITHVSHFDVKNVFEALTALEEKVAELEKGYVKYSIEHPGEMGAGIWPFGDEVTINLHSGKAIGDPGEFEEWMREALSEWYDGAGVSIIKEEAASDGK